MCYFKDFFKDKILQNSSISRNRETAAQPFHIISVNDLDFRSSTLPTSSGLERV